MIRKPIIIVFMIFILSAAGCFKNNNSDKITIITTIFPLYDFAREVGKEKVNVSILLPPGSEAHSFEPKPRDIISINESEMFVYIGEVMEPWAHDIINSLNNKKLIVIEAGKDVEFLTADNHHLSEEDDHEHENDAEDEHDHNGKDPHIWLDFEIDQMIVNRIAEKLGEIDSANKNFYIQNAKDYNLKLIKLDTEYKNAIAGCELKTIMFGGHFAFRYMTEKYGLSYVSPYEGFTPDAEPAPRKIAELIDSINKNGTEYIYIEELLEPKVAEAISHETGVKLELLNAAHNLSKSEFEQNVTFLQIMEQNLDKLKKGLKYKHADN